MSNTAAIGGPFDCYPPWWPLPQHLPGTVTHYHVGSIQEQMGMDGASKLAAAIERLCDILEKAEGWGGD